MAPNPKDILDGILAPTKQATQMVGGLLDRLRGGGQETSGGGEAPTTEAPDAGGRRGTAPANPKTYAETDAADVAAGETPRSPRTRTTGTGTARGKGAGTTGRASRAGSAGGTAGATNATTTGRTTRRTGGKSAGGTTTRG